MPALGIVDDREEFRSTLTRLFGPSLTRQNGEWECVASPPLHRLQEYRSWLRENDVAVLLIDERLHEQSEGGERHATEDGHDVVRYIRQVLPTLPIFIITAYGNDEAVAEVFGAVEDIIQRNELGDRPEEYLDRMLRAGSRFVDQREGDLAELEVLSERIAEGSATEDDKTRAKAIQASTGIAFALDETRSGWIEEMEQYARECRSLRAQIENYLKEGKP